MNVLRLARVLVPVTLSFALSSFAASAQDCVAYQLNASHTGATTMFGFSGPLEQKWSVDMSGSVSYPLLAEGKIFVTTANSPENGVHLHGLEAATGASVWSAPVPAVYNAGEACYANGKVFVYSNKVTSQPTLDAFEASTGTLLWSQPLTGQNMFTSPPTAGNGMVYIGGAGWGGTVYGLRQSDGQEVWRASVANGDHSSPVVTADGVYVSYSGPQAYKFDPSTGQEIWHYRGPTSGGGGRTAVLYDDNLYVRGAYTPSYDSHWGLVLDAATGNLTSTSGPGYHDSNVAPAFDDGIGYFLEGSVLVARSVPTNAELWRRADSAFVSAPIIINGTVYEGSSDGTIFAYSGISGQLMQTLSVGSPILRPNETTVSRPLTGFGAGNGLFVVAAGNRLVAFGPKGPVVPEPGTITLLLAGIGGTALRCRRKHRIHSEC